MIDRTVVVKGDNLVQTFMLSYCACGIAARKLGNALLQTFVDEAVVGEVSDRKSFVQKLEDAYYKEDDMEDLFPDFVQFANSLTAKRAALVFDMNRLLLQKVKAVARRTSNNVAKKWVSIWGWMRVMLNVRMWIEVEHAGLGNK